MSVAARMIEAVRAGDEDGLRAILRSEPGAASAREDGGDTPLMTALYHGRRDLAELLLAHGWHPDGAEAAALGDVDALRAALDAQPGHVTRFTHDGWTLLHLAAFFGHAQAVRLLLERGSDAGALSINPMRNTPLHAGLAGPLGVDGVRMLLEAGASVRARQHGGYTPLHSAASRGVMEIVELLLERGADPHAVADDGRRPHDLAAERGHPAVADRLRGEGATQGMATQPD